MLLVVSPAKNLDFKTPLPDFVTQQSSEQLQLTQPALLKQTKVLSKHCKTLSPQDLSSLMKISDKLAVLNAERFNSMRFPFTQDNARASVYAFNGDVYTGLDAQTLSEQDIAFAQGHLRILSGLYGVLKPLDLMQAYRLEMGTKLNIDEHSNLYQFWDNTITKELNKDLSQQNSDILVNLASNEYFSAVKKAELKARIITPVFKDEKNGKYKVISFFAKKARGLMARYVIQNKIEKVEDLRNFDLAGYQYDEQSSNDSELVFLRSENTR